MTVLFQNSTTVKSESNKTDYDIIHANNDLGRQKKKLRYGVTFAVAIPLFIVIYFLMLPRLFHNYGIMLLTAAICIVIGYLPSEIIVKSVFGAGTGTGEAMGAPRMFKYVFTEDKIMVSRNDDVINIPYSGIERVTQNPYYYNIYFMGNKYAIDKHGFTCAASEFERLMNDMGRHIEVETN
ncbi:YcxB family protein [uncultured Ruminococcus sp.]|uniref:YcxB family protein n=1 Tax=uncultured Ruminococcus sp. TaxID=165186 RepID=UPI0025DB605D|nr:YcxB family protein [uncultured Ruminococcus sp.]